MNTTKVLIISCLIMIDLSANAQKIDIALEPINLKNILIEEELKQRCERNFNRLESDLYLPSKVFKNPHKDSSVDWPGDFEGRIMLGLILQAQATHRDPKFLEEMIRMIPEKVNTEGYFGPIQHNYIVEQQLSGNGWFLRALCEYYLWKKNPATRAYIQRIIQNLALPTKGYQAKYPIDTNARNKNLGAASGTTELTIGRWKLSTDIGCDYIFLDGLVQAYEITPSAELKDLITEMINRFFQIDLKGINAQTHATLTGLRAILRFYKITKDHRLLTKIIDNYDLYRYNATTANYENFNWFGKPEWSEPCAIVDSYMLSVQLWQLTQNSSYIDDAHRIYYNGIANTQRANGGFGLSNCTIPGHNSLKVIEDEAYWCCTMRGGEGLARAVQYSYFLRNRDLLVPFFNDNTSTIKVNRQSFILKETTKYPFEGAVHFEVLNSSTLAVICMNLAMPSWTKNHKLMINGVSTAYNIQNGFASFRTKFAKGTKIDFIFDLESRVLPLNNKEYAEKYFYTLNYGPLVLGLDTSNKDEIAFDAKPTLYRISNTVWKDNLTGRYFSPVYHLMDPGVNKSTGFQKQIIFKIAR